MTVAVWIVNWRDAYDCFYDDGQLTSVWRHKRDVRPVSVQPAAASFSRQVAPPDARELRVVCTHPDRWRHRVVAAPWLVGRHEAASLVGQAVVVTSDQVPSDKPTQNLNH